MEKKDGHNGRADPGAPVGEIIRRPVGPDAPNSLVAGQEMADYCNLFPGGGAHSEIPNLFLVDF